MPSLFRAFFHIFLILCCVRVGEAKVPGPKPETAWSIGVVNPSGIQGKYQLLSDVHTDILAVSESHHTQASLNALQRSWRATHSSYRSVIAGAPMRPRSHASDAGEWAGVLMAAGHPMRSLNVPWPADLYESGRISFASTFCNEVWVSGGVIYGYPSGKTHIDALDRTNAMLDFAAACILDMSGPRYLCGDWNHELSQLSACTTLAAHGWQEVQDLEFQRTGQDVRHTCKRTSRKDFLWISPELVSWFLGLSLDFDSFADHATLHARFKGGGPCSVRYLWPCPMPVPWATCSLDFPPVDFAHGDPTQTYHHLWQVVESQAQESLGTEWNPTMGGRAAQTKPRKRVGWPAPLRRSRSNEVQPAFFGFSVQHTRWFRQLRRIQAYCSWARNLSIRPATVGASVHGLALWQSVLRSPGFGSSFQIWWPGRAYHGPFDPLEIPTWPPSWEVAVCVYDAMLCEVRLLEARLNAARRSKHTHDRHLDANLVFKDVKRPFAAPVETLLHTQSATVLHVESDELKVSFAQPCHFDDSLPVQVSDQTRAVLAFDTDALWLADVSEIAPGDTVTQSKPLGNLDLIFAAFHEQWQTRWGRHDQIPNSHWQQLVDFSTRVLPHHDFEHLTLTPAHLRAETKRKKQRSATGLDGVSRQDLLLAPDAFWDSVISLYHRAESDGTWPAQILAGKVTSLAKCPGASTVNQYRPVTVFGLLYRLWTSIHARRLLDFADTWIHDGIQGNRRQRQTAHLWRCIALGMEDARASHRSLHGLVADIEKCYNCFPRWPILMMSARCGVPPPVNFAWAGALNSMVRHFRVRDSLSGGIGSSTGLAEGCALSCFGMLLLDHVFHCFVDLQSGRGLLKAHTFVDNWELVTNSSDWALRQLDVILEFASMADLTIDRAKTYAWSTCPCTRRQLRQQGLKVMESARDLGAHMGYSRRYTNHTLTGRLTALDEFWPKLKSSPCPWKTKLHMIRAVAWTRGLHAVSAVHLSGNPSGLVFVKRLLVLWLSRNPVLIHTCLLACLNPTLIQSFMPSL